MKVYKQCWKLGSDGPDHKLKYDSRSHSVQGSQYAKCLCNTKTTIPGTTLANL